MCRPTSARAAKRLQALPLRPSGIFRLDPLLDRVDLGSRRPHVEDLPLRLVQTLCALSTAFCPRSHSFCLTVSFFALSRSRRCSSRS
jgi:hypothetical protein